MPNHNNAQEGPKISYMNTQETLSLPPKIFSDLNHYKSGPLSDRLRALNINPNELTRISVEPSEGVGMLERANAFVVSLYGSADEVRGRLFAKTIFQGQRPTTFKPQVIRARHSIEYQFNQMLLWDKYGLPTPHVMDYVKEIRYMGSESRSIEGISMEGVWSPTHDLDLIAIDQRIREFTERCGKNFEPRDTVNRLEKQIKELKALREEILGSALATVYDFAIFGTPKISSDDVARPKNPLSFSFRRLKHYMQQMVLWDNIDRGQFNIDDLPEQRVKILGPLGGHIHTARRTLCGTIEEFMRENMAYRQGDEFLHHMAYHWVNNDPLDPEPRKRTVIFDADRTTISALAHAQAKVLFNPIPGVDYEIKHSVLKTATDRARLRLESAIAQEKSQEGLFDFDEESMRRNLDFAAVYEMLCCLGRRAQDALINRDLHEKRFHNVIEYKNNHIPEEFGLNGQVNLVGGYDIPQAIARLRHSLHELFLWMRGGRTDYRMSAGQKRSVETLEALVRATNILEK